MYCLALTEIQIVSTSLLDDEAFPSGGRSLLSEPPSWPWEKIAMDILKPLFCEYSL